jgi:hypothetical protein
LKAEKGRHLSTPTLEIRLTFRRIWLRNIGFRRRALDRAFFPARNHAQTRQIICVFGNARDEFAVVGRIRGDLSFFDNLFFANQTKNQSAAL